MREAAKSLARGLSLVLVLPRLLSYVVRARLLGSNRALEGSAESLSKVPGLPGRYLRQAFFSRVLERCAPSAVISFGVLFSKVGATLEDGVYVGPRCHLGLVHLERDVLLAPAVHVTSGAHAHGTGDSTVPIRDQEGRPTRVRIGEGTWVGSGAVIMADVGRHCVIGAGAVVTSPIPDFAVAVGVPAKVIRGRAEVPMAGPAT